MRDLKSMIRFVLYCLEPFDLLDLQYAQVLPFLKHVERGPSRVRGADDLEVIRAMALAVSSSRVVREDYGAAEGSDAVAPERLLEGLGGGRAVARRRTGCCAS